MRLGALAVLLAAAAGCGIDVGPDAEWVPAETIVAPLSVQMGGPPPAMAPTARPATLRVVTYNVEFGGDPDGMAAAIQADPAIAAGDVFLLQEEEGYPAEGSCRTARLAAALGLSWLYVPARTADDDGTHGLAIMSRFPLEAPQVMLLPVTDVGSQRIAVRAEVRVDDLLVPVVTVHLATRLNITDRIVHFRPAVIDLPEAVIVAGDVNTNPYLWEEGTVPLVPTAQIVDTDQAPILDDYMRSLGFATPAAGAGPTEEKLGVRSRLDAIYVRGFAASDAIVERDVLGSDHWPVWTDITLPGS